MVELTKLLPSAILFCLVITLNSDEVFVELVLCQEIPSSPLVKRVDLPLLILHLQVKSVIDFKGFLELQLKECMFMDVRSVYTNLTVFVVDSQLSVREFIRCTSVDLAVEGIMWLRRSELSRDVRPVLIETTNGNLVLIYT